MADAPHAVAASPPLGAACLCAAWCHICNDYRALFDRIVQDAARQGLTGQARWIDIEDEADLVGDLDIETFPTLLVYDAQSVLFAGPLSPQPETLRRLLSALAEQPTAMAGLAADWQALAARLRGETINESDQASGATPSA